MTHSELDHLSLGSRALVAVATLALGCAASDPADAETSTGAATDAGTLGSDAGAASSSEPTSAMASSASDGAEGDATGQPSCERCGGEDCVDLQADEAHCGACDVACPEHSTCADGECACSAGLMACGESCVNVSANPLHCGTCNAPCDAGLVCNAGTCAEGCGTLTECEGGCIDTAVDPMNCGACGRACRGLEACVGGLCSCGGEASYAMDVEPIFVAECTGMGCHQPPAVAAGLDLTSGAGYDGLVGVSSSQCGNRQLVEPGAPAESYLLDKLLGRNLCFGSQMPKMGQSIAATDLETVTAWICGGAAP